MGSSWPLSVTTTSIPCTLFLDAGFGLEGVAFVHQMMTIDVSGEVSLVTLLLRGEKHMIYV